MAKDTSAEELKAALDRIEALESEKSTLSARIEVLESEVLEQMKANEDLQAKLDAAATTPVSSFSVNPRGEKAQSSVFPVFIVDGVTYQFKAHAFRINGQRLSAADACKDEAACQMILDRFPNLVQTI